MPRVTLTQTAATEAVLTVNIGGGRQVTLPVRLIADGHAGVWSRGKLQQLMSPAEALRLATTTEPGQAKALRS